MKIPIKASALISAGTAICGGSATLQLVQSLTPPKARFLLQWGQSYVLNAVALFVFPPLGHALHLTQAQFGTWSGVAIHDISSVVGAASHYGQSALYTATAVKLSRALWIVPISAAASYVFQRHPRKTGETIVHKPQIPWFIALFVLASVVRTFIPEVASWSPFVTHISETGLTLTLFLIGAGLSRRMLKAVGWKPMLQGLVLWLFISATSLGVILLVIH